RDEVGLQAAVREQLGGWFGSEVAGWRHLRTYLIRDALPRQAPADLDMPERPVRWEPGVYVCGDHRDNASIQGAMVSGRRAAAASALLLVWFRPAGMPDWQVEVGLALLVGVWVSTAFVQVPCHEVLARGFDPAVHRRLVRSNGIRTAGWSLRGLLALWMAGT